MKQHYVWLISSGDRGRYASADGLRRGAYALSDAEDGRPELILIAGGSEVGLIVAAAQRLQDEGVAVRLVSMPSWELFEAQSQTYREACVASSHSGAAGGRGRGEPGQAPLRG